MPNLPDLSTQFIAQLALASRAVRALVIAAWLGVAQGSTFNFAPANLLLNGVTLGIAIFVAVRAGKSKVKDETIKELQDLVSAKDSRNRELRDDLDVEKQHVRQIEQGASHLREQLVVAEAKYEEQSQFTAEGALTAVLETFQISEGHHERRHDEIMLALKNVQTALERT
jgi:hypothetical protein